MSIEELEVSGIPDWVVLFGDLRIFQEIKSIIIKHGGSQEDIQNANDKLVYICSNKIFRIKIQRSLSMEIIIRKDTSMSLDYLIMFRIVRILDQFILNFQVEWIHLFGK